MTAWQGKEGVLASAPARSGRDGQGLPPWLPKAYHVDFVPTMTEHAGNRVQLINRDI